MPDVEITLLEASRQTQRNFIETKIYQFLNLFLKFLTEAWSYYQLKDLIKGTRELIQI